MQTKRRGGVLVAVMVVMRVTTLKGAWGFHAMSPLRPHLVPTTCSSVASLPSSSSSLDGGAVVGGRKVVRRRAATSSGGDEAGMVEVEEESEEERLRLDGEARDRMARHVQMIEEAAAAALAAGEEVVDRAAWKWAIRQRIWDLLEKRDLAETPRPVHHRIPNFKGATEANERIAALPEFQQAQCVKVNPDTPQRHIRYLTLANGKLLLVPQPRLRTGFFSSLVPALIPPDQWLEACSSAGVKRHGLPIAVTTTATEEGDSNSSNKPPPPKVDLLVIGSVAVNPATGARLGKGEGFAELEYGIMRMLGMVDDSTLIVTSIRDEQLVDDIPQDKLLRHDVPVDVICTPTQVIRTNTKIPKPTGIYWDLLSPEKLSSIRVLQQLKAKIEVDTGVTLPSGPSEVLPPLASSSRTGTTTTRAAQQRRREQQQQAREPQRREYDLVLKNLPFAATMVEVREWLRSEAGVDPYWVSMRTGQDGRPNGKAFVQLRRRRGGVKDVVEVEELQGRTMQGRAVGVERFVARERGGEGGVGGG